MKIILQILSSLIILINIQTASAETLLKMANAFNIKAVNGSLYSSGFINQDKTLKLPAGLNLIAIEYEEVFENDYDDNFQIVKSNLFLLKIYLNNNQTYQQRLVKPHDAKAAKRYSLNPLFEIISLADDNSLQQSVKFELEALASDQASFIIEKTKTHSNYTIDLTHSKNQSQTKFGNDDSNSDKSSSTPQTTAAKMLDYWWLQATPEERRAFLETHSINQK